MSWEDKSCRFVRNKSIIKMFLTSNHCFQLKYKSIIHNIAFPSEKVWIRREICTDQAPFVSDNRRWTFSTEGRVIMDYGCTFWPKWGFEVKNILMMDLFLTNMQLLSSQDVNWWTGVVWITCGLLWCFYQLIGLTFWRHPCTAEDPLVSKHFNFWVNCSFNCCFSLSQARQTEDSHAQAHRREAVHLPALQL